MTGEKISDGGPAFTAGPWTRFDSFGRETDNGPLVGPRANPLSPVCSVTGYYGPDGFDANTNLIAAAPDLYAALASLRDGLNELWDALLDEHPELWDESIAEPLDKTERALRSARGGA